MVYAVVIVDQYSRREVSPAIIAHYLDSPKDGVLVRAGARRGATVFSTRNAAARAIDRSMCYSERNNLGWYNNYQIVRVALSKPSEWKPV